MMKRYILSAWMGIGIVYDARKKEKEKEMEGRNRPSTIQESRYMEEGRERPEETRSEKERKGNSESRYLTD